MNPDLEAPSANVFGTAVQWLDATVLGTLATIVAVLAVAVLGFLLMTGRIDIRRAAQVILGCFIVFGASSIASGISEAVAGSREPAQIAVPETPPSAVYPPAAAQTGKALPYDPYAGAAMPSQR